jgi:hypothetical protein
MKKPFTIRSLLLLLGGVVEVVYGVLYWNGLIETDGFNTAMYAWCVAIMAFNLALRE